MRRCIAYRTMSIARPDLCYCLIYDVNKRTRYVNVCAFGRIRLILIIQ